MHPATYELFKLPSGAYHCVPSECDAPAIKNVHGRYPIKN
jgi:hypothetical protein